MCASLRRGVCACVHSLSLCVSIFVCICACACVCACVYLRGCARKGKGSFYIARGNVSVCAYVLCVRACMRMCVRWCVCVRVWECVYRCAGIANIKHSLIN